MLLTDPEFQRTQPGRVPKLEMNRSWVLKGDIQNQVDIKGLSMKEDDRDIECHSYSETNREKMYGEVSPDCLISKWLRKELKIDGSNLIILIKIMWLNQKSTTLKTNYKGLSCVDVKWRPSGFSLQKGLRRTHSSHKAPFRGPVGLKAEKEMRGSPRSTADLWCGYVHSTSLKVPLPVTWTYSKDCSFFSQIVRGIVFFLVAVSRFLSFGDDDAIWSKAVKGSLGLGL